MKVLEMPYPINLAQAATSIHAATKSTFIELGKEKTRKDNHLVMSLVSADGSTVVYGKSS